MKKLIYLAIVIIFTACSTGNKPAQTEQPAANTVTLTQTQLHVSGMHCENCVASVTKGLSELAGVDSVAVTLADSTAIVSFDAAKVDIEKLTGAIEARGYTARIKTEGVSLSN